MYRKGDIMRIGKITIIGCLLLFTYFALGCSENALKSKVNEFLFNDTLGIQITVFTDDDYSSIITGQELENFKAYMKSIRIVKKYSTEVVPLGGFRKGYKGFLIKKENDPKMYIVLYSIKEQSILIRESDILQIKPDIKNITIVECKIPKKAVNLLKKHESKLPTNGTFITTFSVW